MTERNAARKPTRKPPIDAPIYLLDVNAWIALLVESHVHHRIVTDWFAVSGRRWALCPFTEAGILRFLLRPKTGDLSMPEMAAMLARLREHHGYHYLPVTDDWQTLTLPFARRLHGHNQITDAWLLGLAVRHGMILITFDKGLLHLAGDLRKHVHLLNTDPRQ